MAWALTAWSPWKGRRGALKYMTDCMVSSPDSEGSDQAEWAGATDGRILTIKFTRPDSSNVWQFIGIYQHVAKSSNRRGRSLVRGTLEAMATQTRQDCHRVVIIGDFNAAPPGGRWGYAPWIATLAEDRIMDDWVRAVNLEEVLPGGKPIRTWIPNEGRQRASLDRVFASQADPGLMQPSVPWCQPLIVFDHALLILRIPHGQVGSGYAGACRPDRSLQSSDARWTSRNGNSSWGRGSNSFVGNYSAHGGRE